VLNRTRPGSESAERGISASDRTGGCFALSLLLHVDRCFQRRPQLARHPLMTRILEVHQCQLVKSGDSAQNLGQAAFSDKNVANERINFSLSSRNPSSSSSQSRCSCKSLPKTCVSCEYR